LRWKECAQLPAHRQTWEWAEVDRATAEPGTRVDPAMVDTDVNVGVGLSAAFPKPIRRAEVVTAGGREPTPATTFSSYGLSTLGEAAVLRLAIISARTTGHSAVECLPSNKTDEPFAESDDSVVRCRKTVLARRGHLRNPPRDGLGPIELAHR